MANTEDDDAAIAEEEPWEGSLNEALLERAKELDMTRLSIAANSMLAGIAGKAIVSGRYYLQMSVFFTYCGQEK